MSAAPEGIAYLSLNSLKTSEFDPHDVTQFTSHLLVDIGLNHCSPELRPANWTHPRYDERNDNFPYYQWSVMYGRDAHKISRIRRICADWDKHGKPTEAGLLPIPMPRGEERYFWTDMTFPIRGIYFPICPLAPPPYRDLCTYVRLDFKHRNLDIPFARPYSLDIMPEVYHENLKFEIEKARLSIGPDKTLISVEKADAAKYGTVDGQAEELKGLYLHPYLRDTPAYSADLDGTSKDSDFFQEEDAQTQKCKKMMDSWLASSQKVPAAKEQEDRLQKMKDFAIKNNLTRTHDHDRMEIAKVKGKLNEQESHLRKIMDDAQHQVESIVGHMIDRRRGRAEDPKPTPFVYNRFEPGWFSDGVATMKKVKYSEKETSPAQDEFVCPLTAIMTSPDDDPDALMAGKISFQTTTEWGFDIHPQVTLRFDVKALQTLLAIPTGFRQPRSYDEEGGPVPLDVYEQNLVLAFGAEDIKTDKSTVLEGYNFEFSMNKAINYTKIVKGEFGLDMQYVPAEKSFWEQLASFAVQMLAVAADLIPVVGPFLSVAIYMGGNILLDEGWKSWDNCAPPILASMIGHRQGLGKWTVKTANRANKLRIGV